MKLMSPRVEKEGYYNILGKGGMDGNGMCRCVRLVEVGVEVEGEEVEEEEEEEEESGGGGREGAEGQ